MTDLLETDQAADIRQVFEDLSDTFAFPIIIKKIVYAEEEALATAPTVTGYKTVAIRGSGSSSSSDRLRNELGPTGTHEMDIYVFWGKLDDLGLITADDAIDLNHNDRVEMAGEDYEILAFLPVGDMTKQATFAQFRIKKEPSPKLEVS